MRGFLRGFLTGSTWGVIFSAGLFVVFSVVAPPPVPIPSGAIPALAASSLLPEAGTARAVQPASQGVASLVPQAHSADTAEPSVTPGSAFAPSGPLTGLPVQEAVQEPPRLPALTRGESAPQAAPSAPAAAGASLTDLPQLGAPGSAPNVAQSAVAPAVPEPVSPSTVALAAPPQAVRPSSSPAPPGGLSDLGSLSTAEALADLSSLPRLPQPRQASALTASLQAPADLAGEGGPPPALQIMADVVSTDAPTGLHMARVGQAPASQASSPPPVAASQATEAPPAQQPVLSAPTGDLADTFSAPRPSPRPALLTAGLAEGVADLPPVSLLATPLAPQPVAQTAPVSPRGDRATVALPGLPSATPQLSAPTGDIADDLSAAVLPPAAPTVSQDQQSMLTPPPVNVDDAPTERLAMAAAQGLPQAPVSPPSLASPELAPAFPASVSPDIPDQSVGIDRSDAPETVDQTPSAPLQLAMAGPGPIPAPSAEPSLATGESPEQILDVAMLPATQLSDPAPLPAPRPVAQTQNSNLAAATGFAPSPALAPRASEQSAASLHPAPAALAAPGAEAVPNLPTAPPVVLTQAEPEPRASVLPSLAAPPRDTNRPSFASALPRIGETPPAEPPAESAAPEPTGRSLEDAAADFDGSDGLPRLAVILRDSGAVDVQLSALGQPLSIALPPNLPEGAARAAGYREAGFEILFDASALDLSATEAQAYDSLPDPVAYLAGPDLSPWAGTLDALLGVMEARGRGLITQASGLNPAAREAARMNVPSVNVDRGVTAPGGLSSALDRAAFEAGRQGQAVITLPLTAEVLEALALWQDTTRGQSVALAPVSALLRD